MIGIDYFDWLHNQFPSVNREIFKILSERDYIWQMDFDINRAYAGSLLRELYAMESGVYLSDVADGPCTVLEMLCAIAIDMCSQSGIDDKSMMMNLILSNLGITNVSSIDDINNKLNVWLYREYDEAGVGNIFTVPGCEKMLKIDTWQQMHIYLNYMFPFDEKNIFN